MITLRPFYAPSFAALLLMFLITPSASAQVRVPRPSQKASVMQTIGGCLSKQAQKARPRLTIKTFDPKARPLCRGVMRGGPAPMRQRSLLLPMTF